MDTGADSGWRALLLPLLVAANAFFVAIEFAIVKVRVTQLKPLLKGSDWRLPLALQMVREPDRFLPAIQIGVSLASIGLGWAGQPIMTDWLNPLLLSVGLPKGPVLHSVSSLLGFILITFVCIALGELTPKFLALQHSQKIVLLLSPPLLVFYYLFYPFVWILHETADLLLRLLGFALPPPESGSPSLSREELQQILIHSPHAHPFDELINKIMVKALRLRQTRAEHVMVPRERAVVLWRDAPIEETIRIAQSSGYSRFPVCAGSKDQVVGIILLQELLWQYIALGKQTTISAILRPALFFPPNILLPAMLEEFRKARTHMAIVNDGEGRMLGLVTFEDVLEELVGDIRDEFDIEKNPIYELTPDSATVDGDLPLRDLAIETNWPLPTETTQTVSQWCLAQWGRQPRRFETIQVDGFRLVAEDVLPQKFRRVRIERLKEESAEEAAASE
ncbi:Hemolysin activation protein [Methylacidimicrobium sp. AP8]|uniref:hemolysin family protein n=1 Tax=Methylacidimicrobium sp. AP8 TaxID=2730359 RepID=UPI0018C01BF1|nr:hemolysin family protein [Methylacidimicrobium sp. AP8]CAB4242652.1 Hemolysin activation protein [Methylacidimicrobium sp. AP8]